MHPMSLTLYAESGWVSPWVFHALVALEEKQLPYDLRLAPLPLPAEVGAALLDRAATSKVPVLRHDDFWVGESLAISEYLAETFPFPAHPRLFPADLRERARARQVMSFLRTDLAALRAARPTTTVFGAPATTPLEEDAAAAAATLVRVAERAVPAGRASIGAAFSIADADLALALMRLVKSGDPVPARLVAYAEEVWARPSVQRFLARGA